MPIASSRNTGVDGSGKHRGSIFRSIVSTAPIGTAPYCFSDARINLTHSEVKPAVT